MRMAKLITHQRKALETLNRDWLDLTKTIFAIFGPRGAPFSDV
jgi:hypothetical protein